MMKKTKSIFLICVKKTEILSCVMLPNTKHLNKQQRTLTMNKLNDVLGLDRIRSITSGQLCLHEDGTVNVEVTSAVEKPLVKHKFYNFQKCKKRFLAHNLVSKEGDIVPPNQHQKKYLDAKLIAHAWVALHNGLIVGMVMYPRIKNFVSHDKQFYKYQSHARKALQTLGYVVSCDMVLTKDNQLKFFNVHTDYERKGKILPYFTRELPATSHLQFFEPEIEIQNLDIAI